ncbi:MAG: DNA mismatch repair endonuclease MutL [Bacteroidetes bacterium]|nr:DNA mismatch repair endonuclease MutL [Bacteroidota bacterium]MCW5897004.1 DNA mismatch repair endonuclease MutL [Bacteroidota bacterium]
MNNRRVQVLSEHLANQIAAGEVIQRPESVVKELLENSLDADAKNLLVAIKEGGKKLIQIVDDGMGMDEQDAVASFLRHATSKISSIDDLEGIQTYGFRGEALASVAAVARVTMKTRRREDDTAVVLQIDGGSKPQISREGREPGTSITVHNLFFNVPARRKFLKSNNTEFRHIYDAVQRVALSHPEVALKFISDDETIFDLKSATLEERMLDVFGDRQVEQMVWLEERSAYVSVSGFIGKPVFGQKSRAHQYLFLNKRFITNRNISHAVYTAYENLLVKGTFPFFLLFLEIDPHRVDVNVHPSKMEAKFEDEQNIYRFVSNGVRRTLASNNLVPAMSSSYGEDKPGEIGLQFTRRQHSWPVPRQFVDRSTGEIITPGREPAVDQTRMNFRGGAALVENLLGPIDKEFEDAATQTGERAESHGDRLPNRELSPIIWQLHNKYILTPIENGLMIVDQHVAHERILYERALRRFDHEPPPSQQLLFPQTIELNPSDFSLANELLPHLERLGFSLKPFGRNTVVVEGIPPDVPPGTETKIIEDMLSLYKEHLQHGMMDARDNLAKSFSCRSAIKAGDPLGEQEMKTLLDQLFRTSMPYVCPHGRPVVLRISIDELDRRFGRT